MQCNTIHCQFPDMSDSGKTILSRSVSRLPEHRKASLTSFLVYRLAAERLTANSFEWGIPSMHRSDRSNSSTKFPLHPRRSSPCCPDWLMP